MYLNEIRYQRLADLEETLDILYKKLGYLQKKKTYVSIPEQFNLEQIIEREIIPEIRKYEIEYGQILSEVIQEAFLVSDEEAKTVLVQIEKAVEHIENIEPDNYAEELISLLQEIRKTLNDPGKTAAAKLKVALPIIPLIASYELEMDTEAFMVKVWRGIKSLWRNKA